MSRIWKILIAVVAVPVVVVVGGVVVLMSMDFNAYRGVIAEEAKGATGRDLTIAGDLDLEISLNPKLAVEGVTFANAPWGTRPQMMELKRLEAEVDLLPLLSGTVEVKRLVLVGLDVLAETDKEGNGNWVFQAAAPAAPAETEPAGEGGPGVLPVVRLVHFEDVKITYLDGQSGEKMAVVLDTLDARADGLDSPLVVDLAGTYNGAGFEVAGVFGSFKQLLEGGAPFPVKLDAKVPGVTVGVDGSIAEPMQGTGLDLGLMVAGKDLGPLGQAIGAALPPLPPFDIAGRLKDGGGGYAVEDLTVKIGASDLSGRAAVTLGGARPAVDVTLNSKLINLDELLPKGGGEAAPAKEEPKGDGSGRVFPDDPLPLDGLKAADARVAFRGGQILVKGLTIADVVVDITLKNGALQIKPLKANVAGGGIDASLVLDAGQAVPTLTVVLGAKKLTVGQVLKDMGITDIMDLRLDADVEVKGSGQSVRAIMAGLNGRTNVVGREGMLNSDAIGAVTTGVLDAMPWANNADANKINCVVSRFDIKKGLATSKALVFDTNGMSVLGEGSVNLAEETIDIGVVPESKSVSLASLAIPIRIGGTFAAPSFGPDPAAIAKGTAKAAIGMVSKPAGLVTSLLGAATSATAEEEDPCVQALSGKKKPAAQTQAKPAEQPAKKPEEGLLQGLGSSIGGLFGGKKN